MIMRNVGFVQRAKRAALPATCVAVMLYFGAHALFGTSGYFALDEIRRDQAELLQKKMQLEEQHRLLERNIALLAPEGVNPDYADELVRRHLGVMRPDELVIPLEPHADG